MYQGVMAIVKPCTSFVMKEISKVGQVASNIICGWIWIAMWKHTSLIMFMTFMHDEVWLPFLLSMISVVIIIGLVYLPKDTGSLYIPKQHWKWSRYRDMRCRMLIKRFTASTLFMCIEEFMYTKCRRTQTRSTTLSRTIMTRILIPAKGIAMQMCKGIHVVWRWFIQKLDQSQQGASGLVGQAILVVTTASRLQTALIIGAICLFASILSVYQNEMRRKLLTIKSIINGIAMSRVVPSTAISMQFIVMAYEAVCNNWSAVSGVTSSHLKWMGIVDSCSKQQTSFTTTACVYAIACCLVLLQDCLSLGSHDESCYACNLAPHQDGGESMLINPNEDDECFYDCDQSISDVTFMPATTSNSPGRSMKGQGDLGLDSDSYWMAVDNCCTSCISNCLTDFIGPMTTVTARMKGIGGVHIVASMKGTPKWKISDDDGRIHTFLIKDSFYHKSSPYRLLSPQHLAQMCYDDARGTWCGTYRDGVDLHWDHDRFKRSIPLNSANIALMRSAPGYDSFDVFASAFEEIDEGESWTCMPTAVSDDENDSDDDDDDNDPDNTRGEIVDAARRHPDLPDSVFPDQEMNHEPKEKMSQDDEWLRFVDEEAANQTAHIIPEDEEVQMKTTQADFLAWHYRLGHLSFEKIRQMAVRGDLPAALRDCRVPKCAACMFGKARKRAWRSKAPVNKVKTPPVTAPGSVVAIDQMISAVPGFLAQMRGFITGKRYKVITVFVDQFSDLSFVYTQKSTTAEETVQAKEAFERYAKSHQVMIKHYHADNGIFTEAEFVRSVEKSNQTISFCGVNAHHMNGHAEKRIRDLQENARAMLLHAKRRWPSAVIANLWPYAVRMANDVHNFAPSIKEGVSPIERFLQVQVSPRVRHSHAFGCPVYTLDGHLQAGKRIPKWENRSRIGLFLGWSPRHLRKVALVLNLITGHESPQFHVEFDDLFETMRPSAGNHPPPSLWQQKAGFLDAEKDPKAASQVTVQVNRRVATPRES
jgi:GAG-pre-integrase domain